MEKSSQLNKRDFLENIDIPPIYNIEETIEMLLDTKKSFSRFGDGELSMITNSLNQGFQDYDSILSKRLRDIFTSEDDDVEIGLNRIYFYKDGKEHPFIENLIYGKCYKNVLASNDYIKLLTRSHYYDSVITIPYHHYLFANDYFVKYYNKVKKIFRGRNVLVVSGDDEILGYDNNIFESAKSFDFIKVSKRNAFSYYERIFDYVLKRCKKDTLVLPICGHTATVLSYDLGKLGIQTIDIGHLAKEYNSFCNCVIPYSFDDEGFF